MINLVLRLFRLCYRIIDRRRRQRQRRLSRRTGKHRKLNDKKCINNKKEEEQDATMKSRGNLYDDHRLDVISKDNNSSSSGLYLAADGHKVVDKTTCEILSRLPVKSLTRFKCVCKLWRLSVEKDPYFIDLHRNHSNVRPNLFFVVNKPLAEQISSPAEGDYTLEESYRQVFLVTCNYFLDEGKGRNVANIQNIREIDVPICASFFGPVNGLIGFYDCLHYSGVRISNVCTQETTPWMKSATLIKYMEEHTVLHQSGHCQLGFDPATKEHKVICIWNIDRLHILDGYVRFIEVLTVGEHGWRTVEVPSNMTFEFLCIGRSIHVNGSIYYRSIHFMESGQHDNDKIVVFDVGREKFRSITVPNFIIVHSRDIDNRIYNGVDFLEMDGRLALLCRINCYLVKLWLYDDDDDVGDDHKTSSWREVTIELPFIWDPKRPLAFLSVVGKYQIIIKSWQHCARESGKSYNFSYYSYNWRKKALTRMETNGIPPAIQHNFNTSYIHSTYIESLLPVQ